MQEQLHNQQQGAANADADPLANIPLHAWQIPFMEDRSPLILSTGSAGGGKTFAAFLKVHRFLKAYPGAIFLMVRKSYRSMVNTTLLNYKGVIANNDKSIKHIESKQRFEYSNGSMLAYGGMHGEEEREAIRGVGLASGLDGFLMEEATGFEEDDLNELLARLRGRASDYRFGLLLTNPGAPNHWIHQRLILSKVAKIYYSSAADNPSNPADYIDSLNRLTGILYQRLVLGKWVQAEGVIYDNFDPEHNVTFDAEYNHELPVTWALDDGYAYGQGVGTASYHPRVILFAQETPTGGFNVFDEYTACNELSEVTVANALARPYLRPQAAYADSSAAELRGRLWNAGIMTVAATHPVHEGIKNLRRLICDGNGVRLFRVHPRCKELIREFVSYRYDDNSTVVKIGERQPLKLDDHHVDTCLIAGTKIATLRGDIPIEQVIVGDQVLTRQGYQRVSDAGMTNPSADVLTVTFDDGTTLTGTGNHPLQVEVLGWVELRNLRIGDNATSHSTAKTKSVVALYHEPQQQPVYNLTVNAVPEYFANGVLVHNCRYLCWHVRYNA